jgi:HEAT repeat protein
MPSPSIRAALRADDLNDLLEKLPAADRETAESVCKELLKGGKQTIVKLIVMLAGKQDASARRALHGLAVYSARPGADTDRGICANALAEQLAADHSAAVKAFLLQQLQYCGGAEVVPAVARMLTNEALVDPAAQALVRIGGEKAATALREALAKVKGKGQVAIIQGLGKLRDTKAAVLLTKASGDKDRDLRLAALDALAQIAHEGSVDTFLSAVPEKPSLDRGRVLNACLVYAERLHETGQAKMAETYLARLKTAVKDEKSAALVGRTQARLFAKKGDEK